MNATQNAVLCREYLDWLANTKGRTGVTVYNYTSTLSRFLEHVSDIPLGEVSLAKMETYVRRPRGGRAHGAVGSPSSQAKDVAIIRAMYAYLHARGHVHVNPAALLGAPKVRNQNPRPIPDDDWCRLWSEAQPGVERVFLGLGCFVGLRRREICELRVDQVFVQRHNLVGFKRKGGGDDVTPYGDLCEVLALALPRLGSSGFGEVLAQYALSRPHGHYLIEYGEQVLAPQREVVVHELEPGMTDPGLLNRRMKALCARAVTPSYTPHQLRHTFVTNLLRAGVPLHLVQRMANHSSPAVTSRYIKAGASELREWMATVNRHG